MRPHKNHSYSRVSTFVRCQRCYALDTLFPEKFDSPAIKRGTHVHNGLEAICKRMAAGISPKIAIAAVVDSTAPDAYLSNEEFSDYMWRALPILKHLTPIEGAVEKWFDTVVDLPFVGKIDLVSSTTPVIGDRGEVLDVLYEPCVIDWKTTGSPHRIPTPYEASKALQLKIYCLATHCSHAGYVYFLPSGEPVMVMAQFSEKDLKITYKWLKETMNVIDYMWEGASEDCNYFNEDVLLVKGYDLQNFALASPNDPLCSKKWCRHWENCFDAD